MCICVSAQCFMVCVRACECECVCVCVHLAVKTVAPLCQYIEVAASSKSEQGMGLS